MTWMILITSLWLGILTSISPCPLATNIAAISFIGRKVGNARNVLLSGTLYTAGRTAAYLLLSVLILAGLAASSDISGFLQKNLNQILGPVLILVGMLLLGMFAFTGSLAIGSELKDKAAKNGTVWAMPIGVLFALSFCPVSAGLFFGGLIPLSMKAGSSIILPAAYGIGTALPVLVFSILIAYTTGLVGKAFNVLTQVERWVRTATGVVFICAGIYYSLRYVYQISLF